MSKKNQNNEWLVYTKSAKRGLVAVVVILLIAVILPRYLAVSKQSELKSIKNVPEKVKKAIAQQEEQKDSKRFYKKTDKFKTPARKFNPNDFEKLDWMNLGLSDKQAASIINYTNKGGKFFKTEDVKKMYVISDLFYNQIKDSIHIPKSIKDYTSENFRDQKTETNKVVVVNIDLNSASKEELMNLRGIGDYFATKILEQRNRLGGFYEKEQLLEIYNFKPETFENIQDQISIDKTRIRKININTASVEELKEHPYIRWKIANSIVNYRNQHGKYGQLSDLLQSVLINQELLDKFAPYLSI